MNRILLILSIFFSVVFLANCHSALAKDRVCISNKCISVELAITDQDRMRGLQNRLVLNKDHGMLFVFPSKDRYAFWMKDTLISLDIIWIDNYRRVVDLKENIPPCKNDPCSTYEPSANAYYVLELNAGVAQELGIKKGSELEFHLETIESLPPVLKY